MVETESDSKDGVCNNGSHFQAKKTPQYLAALAATVGAFGLGTVLGWSSGGIPSMAKTGDFGIEFTEQSENASWVASICTLGCLAASLTMGFPLEMIGRKWTMLALSIPALIGWMLMGLSSNIPMLLAGRFITGFCGGSFTLIYPIYTSEIAESEIRGILGNVMNIILCSGTAFVYALSTLLSWDQMSFVCGAVPVILFFAVLLFVPESPHYLLKKGRETEARASLKRLRGAEDDSQIDKEFLMIRKSITDTTRESLHFSDLLTGSIIKPTCICMMLMVLQHLSGITIVLFYAESIFSAAKTDFAPDTQTVIIGGVQVAFVVVSTLLVERLGRKTLLVVSDFGISVSLAMLGTFFYFQEHDPDRARVLEWLPLTSLVLFTITYNLGVGPLPWTVTGELVPLEVKGLAGSLASAACWTLGFIIPKTFHNITNILHTYGSYWFFSVASLLGSLFCLLVVPETKGRTLEEIRAFFK